MPEIQPYAPRPIEKLTSLYFAGWTLKRFAICYGTEPFDDGRFESGRALALAQLPSPAVGPGRVGAGFVIEHQANRVDYLVLGWWDRENELPLRVFVREPGAQWRPARGAESVCVWDLQVIWAEREAYVATVMSGQSRDAYVDAR
jgi:hypothetical protein